MWEDFHNKLVDSTLLNLDEYLLQFPDLKVTACLLIRESFTGLLHRLQTETL